MVIIFVKLDIGRVMKTYVIEIQCDSVVDLLNAYTLTGGMWINPYVEPITPFAWFDKKIVSTKNNLLFPRQWIMWNVDDARQFVWIVLIAKGIKSNYIYEYN